MKNKLGVIILASILIITLIFRVLEVWGGNFAFTMDQGRDMVDLRHMVVTRTPRLVGPTTSINGVLLGPFWYYFNLIPFVATGGDPVAIVIWQIIWYQIAAVLLWLTLKKIDEKLAIISASLFLLMPMGFNISRYFWNANSMPMFTALFFALLFFTLLKPTRNRIISLGVLSGLSMQIEAAFGILFFPVAIIILFLKKSKFKDYLFAFFGFFITLVPQILFEFRHGFIMTKIFIKEFTAKGDMLGEKLSLVERIVDRKNQFEGILYTTNHLHPNIVLVIYILSALFLIIKFKNILKDKYGLIKISPFLFIVFSAIFYLIFPQQLKNWYTLGLSVPFVLCLSFFIWELIKQKNIIIKLFAYSFCIFTLLFTVNEQYKYISGSLGIVSDNKSNYANELAEIDWVYEKAAGNAFKIYSYLPSVYDYPYHFLFWFYGTKKYGYQPSDIAYLPNQAEYIKDVDKLFIKRKSFNASNNTFLIVEEDEDPKRRDAWLGNFSSLCVIDKQVFPWHAEVRMLGNCSK